MSRKILTLTAASSLFIHGIYLHAAPGTGQKNPTYSDLDRELCSMEFRDLKVQFPTDALIDDQYGKALAVVESEKPNWEKQLNAQDAFLQRFLTPAIQNYSQAASDLEKLKALLQNKTTMRPDTAKGLEGRIKAKEAELKAAETKISEALAAGFDSLSKQTALDANDPVKNGTLTSYFNFKKEGNKWVAETTPYGQQKIPKRREFTFEPEKGRVKITYFDKNQTEDTVYANSEYFYKGPLQGKVLDRVFLGSDPTPIYTLTDDAKGYEPSDPQGYKTNKSQKIQLEAREKLKNFATCQEIYNDQVISLNIDKGAPFNPASPQSDHPSSTLELPKWVKSRNQL